MFKIKFRIVFSKRIDSGNARVYTLSVGSYFGISMDLVMVLKYFMKISATSLSSDTISFFSIKIIFLACLIVLFEK